MAKGVTKRDRQRVRGLPIREDETWQGTGIPVGDLIAGGEDPDDATIPLWLAVEADKVGGSDPGAGPEPPTLLNGFVRMAFSEFGGYLPGTVQVKDEADAAALRDLLKGLGVTVEVRPELPEADAAAAEAREILEMGPREGWLLEGEGVTLPAVRSFAEAAAEYFLAAPWRHLSDEDVIEVESPTPPHPGLRCLSVLGAGGDTFGVGFLHTKEDYDALQADQRAGMAALMERGLWSLTFGAIDDLPPADARAWMEHRLAVATDEAYPVPALHHADRLRRPTGEELAYLEGVLRALAGSTEEQFDAGRWTREVFTSGGVMRFTLALPGVLAPVKSASPPADGLRLTEQLMRRVEQALEERGITDIEDANRFVQEEVVGRSVEEIDAPPRTPSEEAQDLVDQAWEARGRRQLALVRQALQRDPDCSDAYVLLAGREPDIDRAIELYERAVRAAEHALGPEAFERDAGHFWGVLETRPYMRARAALAEGLLAADRCDEAIDHYNELLRLNPNDNQGLRYRLIGLLLEQERLDEAGELLDRSEEASALWLWARVLHTFLEYGPSKQAEAALRRAMKENRGAAEFLSGEREWLGPRPAAFSPGGEEEAAIIDDALGPAWGTEEAMEWLAEARRRVARPRRPEAFRRRDRKRRR